MGKFEDFSQEQSFVPHETRSVEDNATQRALIEIWAQMQEMVDAKHNEAAKAWIATGIAKKYRTYIEENPNEVVAISDPDALRDLLMRINGEETIH